MKTRFQKRMERLKTQNRLIDVLKYNLETAQLGGGKTPVSSMIDAAYIALNGLYVNNPYPAMEIRNFRHRLERSIGNANYAFLIQNKDGEWNELIFAFLDWRAGGTTMLPVLRLTYAERQGWTSHMGNIGGLLRLAIATHQKNKQGNKLKDMLDKDYEDD